MASIPTHLRRLGVLALNATVNRPAALRALGALNRRASFLSSVFVAYPASATYSEAYVYPAHLGRMRWHPWLVGAFRQDGKWGLMFVVSSTEPDFAKEDNSSHLSELVDRTERIRQLVGASQKTFAGILPGVLFARRIVRESVEADVTVEAVVRGEAQVRRALDYPDDTPLLLLGGRGFIGRRLAKRLAHRSIVSVDVRGGDPWPDHLRDTPAIAVNVSRRGALPDYLDRWWPELALLNEVYPEPAPDVVSAFARIGAPVFHVVGVEAWSLPPFPSAYAGGIPCCAARLSDDMRTLIRRLG